MEVLHFLKERTEFIRKFYDGSAAPHRETLRKIEAGESPYVPPYSEDGEPPFQLEWSAAGEMLEMVGRCCVSMLSASLHLYFKTWEHQLRIQCKPDCAAAFKKEGIVGGYRTCLAKKAGIDWAGCPADWTIIEQVVLARNQDQHPEDITSVRVRHPKIDRQRYPQPFFLSEHEARMFRDGEEPSLFMAPSLHVSRDLLIKAIEQVELLCEWLEDRLFAARYP